MSVSTSFANSQDFAAMGLHSRNPFDWQAVRLPSTEEQKKLERRRLQQYESKARAKAKRVNPEMCVGYSTGLTNSERAPR